MSNSYINLASGPLQQNWSNSILQRQNGCAGPVSGWASRALEKKRNRIPVSCFVSAGSVIEGNLSCLMCLFGRNRRPSP